MIEWMQMGKRLTLLACAFVFAASMVVGILGGLIRAQESDDESGFALQVAPSPLVASVSPGADTTLELSIRNTSTSKQSLKMGLSSFSVDENSGEVKLGTDEPAEVKDLVSFSEPEFDLAAGEMMTQKITIKVPEDAAFTYTFATTISRKDAVKPSGSTTAIQGSVAVFTLLGVDKPGAERKFELSELMSAKRVYEYLPANFSVKLKNTGNTLVQPKGNIYIQRGSNDQNPVSVIPLNPNNGYILPATNRVLQTDWSDGFPRYENVPDGDTGQTKRKLVWDWSKLSQIRIGKYTAKVVAVYDDGQRDVPVVAEVSFWVMPWRIIGVLLLVLLVFVVGVVTMIRKSTKLVKKHKPSSHEPRE